MRRVVVVLGVFAVAVFAWISTFPTKAECTATGRVVDPTERHCEAVNGFEQLQEHVWFHTSEVLFGAGILGAVGFIGHRYHVRHRSRAAARTA